MYENHAHIYVILNFFFYSSPVYIQANICIHKHRIINMYFATYSFHFIDLKWQKTERPSILKRNGANLNKNIVSIQLWLDYFVGEALVVNNQWVSKG